MLGHVQLLKVKSLLLDLKDFVVSKRVTKTPTKYPYLDLGSDGYVYFSESVPEFVSYPNKPGDRVVVRGGYVTLLELERILQNDD